MSARTGRMRWIAAVSLLTAFLIAGGSSANAYWSVSATHAGSATAQLTLPAPTTMSCSNSGLPPLLQTATLSWSTVTGANRYNLVATRADGTSSTAVLTTNSAALTNGLLGNLLSGLLAPTTLTVRVYPAYENSTASGLWISPNSKGYTATSVLLPIGTTCGAAVTP